MRTQKVEFTSGNVLTLPVRANITRTGKGESISHYITLPAFWCRLKGLKEGDTLSLGFLGYERPATNAKAQSIERETKKVSEHA